MTTQAVLLEQLDKSSVLAVHSNETETPTHLKAFDFNHPQLVLGQFIENRLH